MSLTRDYSAALGLAKTATGLANVARTGLCVCGGGCEVGSGWQMSLEREYVIENQLQVCKTAGQRVFILVCVHFRITESRSNDICRILGACIPVLTTSVQALSSEAGKQGKDRAKQGKDRGKQGKQRSRGKAGAVAGG